MKEKVVEIIWVILCMTLSTLNNFELISKSLDMILFSILMVFIVSYTIIKRNYEKKHKLRDECGDDNEES